MQELFIIVALGVAIFAVYKIIQSSKEEAGEARTLASLPPSAQHVVGQMDSATQVAFFNEYEQKRRKTSIAYLCWLFCGLHYLYLRNPMMLVAYWLTAGGFGLWALYLLFFMKGEVSKANEQIAREALQTLHIATSYHGRATSGGVPAGSAGVTAAPTTLVGPMAPSSPPAEHRAARDVLPAAWHPDPTKRFESRYWDGAKWTDHVSGPEGRQTDPL